eukprot:gene31819-7023_t
MQACLTRMPLSALAALLLGSLLSCSALYNVPTGEWMVATSRLMIADNNPNNTNVAVVELPSFTLSHRVSVPGITQQLGLTADHKSMAVFRARGGNDQHFINFMSTGLVTMSGAVTTNSTVAPVVMPGYMRRMAITRSMFAVNGNDASMGAENGVELLYHPRWKTHLLYAETHGLVATYNATEAAMSGDFSFSKTMYVPIGHYHLVVVDNYIFAAHTGTGEAIMVDQEGTVVNRFPCAGCHGSEKYETEELSEGGFSANFAAPFVTPFLCNSTVFITVPATGNVHEILVNFTSGVMSMGRVLSLGGQPQMALADSKGEAGQLEPERPKLQRYHLTSNRVHTSAFQGDKSLHSSMTTATSKRAKAAELPLMGNRGARINFRGTKNAQYSIATSNAAGAAEAADLPLTGNRLLGANPLQTIVLQPPREKLILWGNPGHFSGFPQQ